MKTTLLVTTTYYRNLEELRYRLACDMVKAAVTAGYMIVIVDGSPIPEVAAKFRELGAQVYPQLHKGMGPSRREAFFHAIEVAWREGAQIILWLEPEKVDLIRFIPAIVKPIENGEVSVVIPHRSEAAWASWPAFQRKSEEEANALYNELAGLSDFDPMFGPVAFHITTGKEFALCGNFMRITGVDDSYIQLYVPFWLRHIGYILGKVTVDMIYPPEQKAEEEGASREAMFAKREVQLHTITSAWKALANR